MTQQMTRIEKDAAFMTFLTEEEKMILAEYNRLKKWLVNKKKQYKKTLAVLPASTPVVSPAKPAVSEMTTMPQMDEMLEVLPTEQEEHEMVAFLAEITEEQEIATFLADLEEEGMTSMYMFPTDLNAEPAAAPMTTPPPTAMLKAPQATISVISEAPLSVMSTWMEPMHACMAPVMYTIPTQMPALRTKRVVIDLTGDDNEESHRTFKIPKLTKSQKVGRDARERQAKVNKCQRLAEERWSNMKK